MVVDQGVPLIVAGIGSSIHTIPKRVMLVRKIDKWMELSVVSVSQGHKCAKVIHMLPLDQFYTHQF